MQMMFKSVSVLYWSHHHICSSSHHFQNKIIPSFDRHELDLYLGDDGALPAPLVVVRPLQLGQVHVLEHGARLPTLLIIILGLLPSRHLDIRQKMAEIKLSLLFLSRLTRQPFLGENSTGSRPLQSNTTIVLNLLLSSWLYLATVSARMSIEFSRPHSCKLPVTITTALTPSVVRVLT